MQPIGLIFNGVWSQYSFAKATKYQDIYELIYIHDLNWERIKDKQALVIPFQSNQKALSEQKQLIYEFLATGRKVFVEGDSSASWLDAQWEDRPVNNYWWVNEPDNPPISHTDNKHPIYKGLKPRHACWHTHGVYTRLPEHAQIIQTNEAGEIITWQSKHYGGTLMATTLDPIVEHGVQQITHLDNYVDRLTYWLCGIQPQGDFEVEEAAYGVDWGD